MGVEVKVWSDFVCPFCMIAEQPLLEAVRESGLDVHIDWMPFELRPWPTPTLRPEEGYLQRVWPQSVYPLAERHGVKLRLPSVSPQPYTALAWEGYQFAREQGKGSEYNDRVLRAFFQEDQDIGQPEVLARLAGEVGLDEAAFGEALAQRRYREAHARALAQARAMGVTAVPTFMIGRRLYPGAQNKEVLARALRAAAGEADPAF
ncbi:DsbA family oxidoreductase [Azohydromonas caseinilytica]|uniref:DsbA family oxidoreductase n=1 Tax=Azohydromonas caseinilytica TaxID=2728836 RepID=A0A848FCP3_9BURK|nr:DsbA family oxidoreductase [Azohydromonas caseinilytica]NML17098.1 DsbA family oxidoreductase [Azohydromonas caseinilytica]